MKKLQKEIKKVMKPKETAKISYWQGKLDNARAAYSDDLKLMQEYYNTYKGERHVKGNPNSNKASTKLAVHVWNIIYELIESQVDSSIPSPKVTAIHEGDEEQAKIIEKLLINEMRRMRFNKINDFQERMTPIRGGDFFHVEWDANGGSHCHLGDLSVTRRSAIQVIPQPGVTELEDMDYIFIQVSQTKDYVKRRYGVDVSLAEEENPEIRNADSTAYTDDIVTVNIAYFRNENGGIGRFTWCDTYLLEDFDDYQDRMVDVCAKCGALKESDQCECGSKKFVKKKMEEEAIFSDIQIGGGEILKPYTEKQVLAKDPYGEPMLDDITGQPIITIQMEQTKIPYYKPNVFPIVIRRNVSSEGDFLGFSDAEIIQDQQNAIKKLSSKIEEKLLKGGSIVTLPEGVQIETDDKEMKIVRVKDPSQKNLIDCLTLQADVTVDRSVEETHYQHAKSILGINDSFQGKYDSSATSGTAKQYQINQAAGRLESKRVNKNTAYSELYELMFKFLLAYADQPIEVPSKGPNGQPEYAHFDRYMFLKRDAAGQLYWNDEFIFETDPTSTIMTNREAMWQQADLKLQSGAFGPLGELKTLQLYWQYMEKNNYPNAGEIRTIIDQRIQEQEAMQQAMAIQTGGGENEMPIM